MLLMTIVAILTMLFLELFVLRDFAKDIEKLLSWEDGRQGGGYKKHTFFSNNLLKMDCHLLLTKDDEGIIPHKDLCEYGKHYRLNIVLVKPYHGGKFYCNRNIFSLGSRIYLFRPDKYSHFVTPSQGRRLVLSFGKVI